MRGNASHLVTARLRAGGQRSGMSRNALRLLMARWSRAMTPKVEPLLQLNLVRLSFNSWNVDVVYMSRQSSLLMNILCDAANVRSAHAGYPLLILYERAQAHDIQRTFFRYLDLAEVPRPLKWSASSRR